MLNDMKEGVLCATSTCLIMLLWIIIRTTDHFYLTAPDDYGGADVTRVFIFPGGATTVSFPIPIVNDDVAEDVEQFTISLSTNDSLATLGPDSVVQITNNDREFILMYIVCHDT